MASTAQELTQKEAQGAQSRRQILDAALDLMSERGYAATSISAISKKSGLPASSIYWHFESKEGLLAAVLEDGATSFVDSLPKFEELTGTPEERLTTVSKGLARGLAQGPRFLRLLLVMGLESGGEILPTLGSIRSIRQRIIERTARSMEATILPDGYSTREKRRLANRLALFSMVVVDGAYIAHQIDPSVDLEGLFELQLNTLINNLSWNPKR
ncbi:MAG: TetR/AcrR family transcriptional regulator [Parvibaculum sp.]